MNPNQVKELRQLIRAYKDKDEAIGYLKQLRKISAEMQRMNMFRYHRKRYYSMVILLRKAHELLSQSLIDIQERIVLGEEQSHAARIRELETRVVVAERKLLEQKRKEKTNGTKKKRPSKKTAKKKTSTSSANKQRLRRVQ